MKSLRAIFQRLDVHMSEVVKGAFNAMSVKVVAAGVAFSFNIVLARFLGAKGAGLFYLALGTVMIGAVIARFGLDKALLRYVAASAAREDWSSLHGVYRNSIWIALGGSVLVALAVVALAPFVSTEVLGKPELESPLKWMALAIVPLALFNLHSQALQGLKMIRQAVAVLSLWTPLFAIVAVVILAPRFGVSGAAGGYGLAAILTLVVGMRSWRNVSSENLPGESHFPIRRLMRTSFPLYAIMLLHLTMQWSSTFLLGVWATSEEVGVFNAAQRTAMLTSFVLVAVNSIAAPKFAALYELGETGSLAKVAQQSATLMTLMAGPILLVFLIFPEFVMSMFGDDFENGKVALSILAVGQFVNVMTGSVGQLLMMTGHERLFRNNLAFCAVLHLTLSCLLIPPLGIAGAAIGAAIVLALQNLIAVALTRWKLGITTLPNPFAILGALQR